MSAVFAAIANILARTLLKDIRSRDVLGVNFFIMALTLLVLSPLFFQFSLTWLSLGLIVLIGIIDAAANYFYFKTFENSEASAATPLLSLAPGFTFMFTSIAPIFTFLFGWFLLDDVVSLKTFILTLIIILFIIIFSFDKKQFKHFHKSTLFPALTSSILFGLSAIPAKALLDQLDAINAPTLYLFRAGLIASLAFVFFKNPINRITKKQYRLIFIRGLFVIAQWVLLYSALSKGNAGVAVALANTTPVFVFILGYLILRERLTLKKLVSAVLIIIMAIALNITI